MPRLSPFNNCVTRRGGNRDWVARPVKLINKVLGP